MCKSLSVSFEKFAAVGWRGLGGVLACTSATLVPCVLPAADYVLAEGATETITASATYDRMVVQGNLAIAPCVTVDTGKFLMASNVTATLTLGTGATLNITAPADSNGQDALFGTYGGRAQVKLEENATVVVGGNGISCFGYCVNATTPAYGTLDLGQNAAWQAGGTTYFNRGNGITLNGFTADTVLSTITLNDGAHIKGSIIRNGFTALLIRFAGGYLDDAQLWSNQTGQTILESVDGADIAIRRNGSPIFVVGSQSSASFTVRGAGDMVVTGATSQFLEISSSSSGAFNWQMEGNLRIAEGGLRFKTDIDLGTSRVVCSPGTTLDLQASLRTAAIDSSGYGSFTFCNTGAAAGTLSFCGSGDLCAVPSNVSVTVEGDASVRVKGPQATGYRYYRFLITKCVGTEHKAAQISEFSLLNGDSDVTGAAGAAYSSGTPNASSANENYTKAFDGDLTTKWLANGISSSTISSSNAWLQVAYTSPQPITGYRWATANDKPRETEAFTEECRDPNSWTLMGSMDGSNWVVLDEVEGYPFHKSRNAYTGDVFTPVFKVEIPAFADRIGLKDGGVLSLAGVALNGDTELVAAGTAVSGTLHVASGTVTCRTESNAWNKKYWRLSISGLKNATFPAQISELALYNANGNRLNGGLTSGGDAVAGSSLAAGQYTASYKGGTLSCYGGQGPDKLFDGDLNTKICCSPSVSKTTPIVITMRLADDAGPVAGYLFASANDHSERDPCTWTLEASDDGIEWTTVDEKTGVAAGETRRSYSAYNGGTPYDCASYPLGLPILQAGSAIRVDHGAVLSLAAAPTPVARLLVDGAGAGMIDVLDAAPEGVLHLSGVARSELDGYTVPLTVGQFINPENLRSWAISLDGDEIPMARLSASGTTLRISLAGTMLIFR